MVSVIFMIYNEVLYIKKVLKSLLELDFVKEIIVVDDGSTEGTRENHREIRQRPNQKDFA